MNMDSVVVQVVLPMILFSLLMLHIICNFEELKDANSISACKLWHFEMKDLEHMQHGNKRAHFWKPPLGTYYHSNIIMLTKSNRLYTNIHIK